MVDWDEREGAVVEVQLVLLDALDTVEVADLEMFVDWGAGLAGLLLALVELELTTEDVVIAGFAPPLELTEAEVASVEVLALETVVLPELGNLELPVNVKLELVPLKPKELDVIELELVNEEEPGPGAPPVFAGLDSDALVVA